MIDGHAAPIASAPGAVDGCDQAGQAAHIAWSRSGAILTRRRRLLVLSGLLAASVVVIVLCSSFGAAALTGTDWLAAVRELIAPGLGDGGAAGTAGVILFQLRVPRVLMGFLVGGALAAVGVTLQALLRNALADPYVLGVSSGAALGAAVAMLL